ncbi:hypothetical protein ZMO02_14980 [Zymomonas mobilis subsp. pomaceae]|nr:hypothetical protein ZMO02_14980 [Zymomonas mobilis subsp. pomaceae]
MDNRVKAGLLTYRSSPKINLPDITISGKNDPGYLFTVAGAAPALDFSAPISLLAL